MPARPWADHSRLEFLKASLTNYEAAKERKRTRQYLSVLHDSYFVRFPQPDERLMNEEKKRVSAWMNNHSGGRGKGLGALSRATRGSFRALLRGKLDEKRRQKLQATQAYSELYWESKLKPIIDAEWDQKILDEPDLPKKHYLAYMNMRVRQIYEAEPEDVKAEVEHYRSAQPDETESTSRLLPGEDDLELNEQSRRIAAREVQSAIDNVEAIMTMIAKDIEDVTGLKAHFMISGPEPKRNGSMVIFTITSGHTVKSNLSFKDHPTYKGDTHDKFLAFAKGCYTREERLKYANVPFPDSDKSSDMVSSSNNTTHPPKDVPHVSQKAIKRKRARKAKAVVSDSSSDLDSEPDNDDERPGPSDLDAARYTVRDDEEADEMDIFSPLLPPDRRIVETKDSAGGLTLYKTAKGEWLSELELERLANMARNARLLRELGIQEAKQQLTGRSSRQEDEDDKEPEIEDDREFSIARTRAAPIPREHHPRISKQNVSYVEKNSDGTESIPVSGSAAEPAPVVTGKRKPVQAFGDSPVVTGDTTEPEPVSCDSDVPVAINNITVSGDSDVAVAIGNVTVAKPTVDTLVPDSPSVSSSTDSTVVHHGFPSPLSNALLAANANSPAPPPSCDDRMEVDDHADLAMSMEVDNHASFDDTPPGQSLAASPRESVRSLNLDTLDLAKVPAWLQLPLKHLRKKFRGELEDIVLGGFVALEMAWQPLEKRIGTNKRPQAVAWWMKNARPIDRVPPCIDLASFPGQVREWWSTIQPQWRVPVIEDWPLPQHIPAGESWQEARLGGSNGLFLIVLCLYWWRNSAEAESDKVALAEYASVAEDVGFVFEAILSSGVSQVSLSPLTGSARTNARRNTKRKTLPAEHGSPVVSRSLRSSGAKENIRPSRAQRS